MLAIYVLLALTVLLVHYQEADGLLGFSKMQSLSVTGTLTCGGEPLQGATVKLLDINKLRANKVLDTKVSDSKGQFTVAGGRSSNFKLNPAIEISHNCKDAAPCMTIVRQYIPKKNIAKGKDVIKPFSVGSLDMKLNHKHEERKCGKAV